ncbi:MAG: hypothetical protein H6564_10085 [Lewinellaceae bacterium]|nr:hypothetical protein [Lewinellaceae bacterium]
MRKWYLLFLVFTAMYAQAQEEMEVIRCSAVSRQSPVRNVFVDENNNKWAANAQGVFRIYDSGLGEPVNVPAGEQQLLGILGGNAELSWSMEAIKGIAGPDVRITCAVYDANRKALWIGTADAGLFQLKPGPPLQLAEHLTAGDSKLRSNHINTVHLDARGRLWAGTEQGVLVGENGRWKLLEKDFNILSIAGKGLEAWLLGDGLVGRVDARDSWLPIEIPARKTEGPLRAITFDDAGYLWIASEVVTRYNPETEVFTVFGPAQEFTSQYTTCLAADHDGAVWVGTEDKGLFLIQKASAMSVNILVQKEVSCGGDGKNGALLVKISGGQPPYSYKWTSGLSGDNPKGLAPGAYSLTLTDSGGKAKIANIELQAPAAPQVKASTVAIATTGQSDGQAKASVTGGASPYSYAWDNGEAVATATKLAPGTHTVTVTDASGCTGTASVSITENILPLAVTLRQSEAVRCAGSADGALEAEVSGGKGPYQYAWSNPGLAGTTAGKLKAGQYSLTVTDASGQSESANITITEPMALQATAMATSPASTGNADGQAKASVTGGASPYSYAWDNGETAATATKLAPGMHTVTVTDASGCTGTASVAVTEDILPLAVTLRQSEAVRCAGSADGALEAEVSGGKGPYQYAWNNPGLAGTTAGKLKAGQYSLTVTDASGQSESANITITEPTALQATAMATSPASTGNADGQAKASVTGGASPYSYAWDNGEAAATATKLAPGTHTVTVTDASGCTGTASVAVTEDILPLVVTLRQSEAVRCAGSADGALEAEVSGGCTVPICLEQSRAGRYYSRQTESRPIQPDGNGRQRAVGVGQYYHNGTHGAASHSDGHQPSEHG